MAYKTLPLAITKTAKRKLKHCQCFVFHWNPTFTLMFGLIVSSHKVMVHFFSFRCVHYVLHVYIAHGIYQLLPKPSPMVVNMVSSMNGVFLYLIFLVLGYEIYIFINIIHNCQYML